MFAPASLVLALVLSSGGLAPGDRAPARLEVHALDGAPLSVELAAPGRVTIVDFFATWCPRCRESLPAYGKLLRAHGDRLRIIVVDVAEHPATVRRFFQRHR